MRKDSKSKLDIYPEVSVPLNSDAASLNSVESSVLMVEKRKEDAEKPIYLKRI